MEKLVVKLLKRIMEDRAMSLAEDGCGGSEFDEGMDILESELRKDVGAEIGMDSYSLAVSAYIPKIER